MMAFLKERPPYWAAVGFVLFGVVSILVAIAILAGNGGEMNGVGPRRIPLYILIPLMWAAGIIFIGIGASGAVKRWRNR